MTVAEYFAARQIDGRAPIKHGTWLAAGPKPGQYRLCTTTAMQEIAGDVPLQQARDRVLRGPDGRTARGKYNRTPLATCLAVYHGYHRDRLAPRALAQQYELGGSTVSRIIHGEHPAIADHFDAINRQRQAGAAS